MYKCVKTTQRNILIITKGHKGKVTKEKSIYLPIQVDIIVMSIPPK